MRVNPEVQNRFHFFESWSLRCDMWTQMEIQCFLRASRGGVETHCDKLISKYHKRVLFCLAAAAEVLYLDWAEKLQKVPHKSRVGKTVEDVVVLPREATQHWKHFHWYFDHVWFYVCYLCARILRNYFSLQYLVYFVCNSKYIVSMTNMAI